MPDAAILTVKIDQTNISYDMELPSSIPGSQLCPKLLAALKNMDVEPLQGVEKINLRIEPSGKILGDDQTLDSIHVWDGRIVTVIKCRAN